MVHMCHKQHGARPVHTNSLAFCLDVVSMYTNMKLERCADASAKLWERWKSKYAPTHPFTALHIYNIILFILSHGYFTFGGDVFKQIYGTGMGNQMAVVIANAFMGAFFADFFKHNHEWRERFPFFKRFLDDIFGFATCSNQNSKSSSPL